MTTSKTINVTITGREFRVTCPDDEREELLQSVSYLDKKMREIRDSGKVIGSERVAIMAALNITHECLGAKVGGDFDIAGFKRRMAGMEAVINQTMAEQTKLF